MGIPGRPADLRRERQPGEPMDMEYSWERLPEYEATQTYSKCLGRIIASLPRRVARKVVRPLTLDAIRLATGIAGCNADVPPGGEELTVEERVMFRDQALEGLRASRRRMEKLLHRRVGDTAEVRTALHLLDRIENWINAGPAAAGRPN
jgi:hypothetical protein